MIRLMGLEVRDAQHPDGDIAIEYIGLRHGEKLLRGAAARREHHADRASAHSQESRALHAGRRADQGHGRAGAAMDANDLPAIHATLMRAVEGYRPELRHLPPSQPTNGRDRQRPAVRTPISRTPAAD